MKKNKKKILENFDREQFRGVVTDENLDFIQEFFEVILPGNVDPSTELMREGLRSLNDSIFECEQNLELKFKLSPNTIKKLCDTNDWDEMIYKIITGENSQNAVRDIVRRIHDFKKIINEIIIYT